MGESNDYLRRARERIESPNATGEPLSRRELAELVNAWLHEHKGRTVELDANYLAKLEQGRIRWPRDPDRREAFRAVLGVATDAELGFRQPRRSRSTLVDVDRKQFIQTALGVAAGTTLGMPLMELFEIRQPTPVPSVIGATEIAQVRTAARVFHNWDHMYGGGLAREAVVAQLRHSVELLNARCPERLRGELFSAVGRLATRAGFMAFDTYAHDDAHRMFQFALSCFEHAGDWHSRANVLYDMALQAFWRNDPDTALTYIELAQVRADRLTPTARAMLSTVRARVLAKLGRVQDTVTAVGVADEEFAQANQANDPECIRWYDSAEHVGETGLALSDPAMGGRFTSEASVRLVAAVEGRSSSEVRSRTFCQIGQATLQMSAGDPHEAAAIGMDAAAVATSLHSHRIGDDLRELRRIAEPHAAIPEVAELRHRIGAVVVGL